jgi:hypothetical protein
VASSSAPQSLYVRESADVVVATELTGGPWSPQLQHGGPPTALLTGAMEAADPDGDAFTTVRVTMELLRPVPIDRLTTAARIHRRGRRVHWLEATLSHQGQEVARATCVRIRLDPHAQPPGKCEPAPPMPSPEASEPFVFPFFPQEVGYHVAIESRIAEGPWAKGPAAAWIRARYPVVPGEPMSGMQRVVLAADAINGVCPAFDTDDWTFINPDMSVHVQRPPRGEWVGLRARSTADPGGTGMVDAEIHDGAGAYGRAVLSLVVAPRAR